MADYDVFREQLGIRFPAYGHALWDPSPRKPERPVQVGDVGFVRKGKFHCLFNALCPKGEQSDVPDGYEPLVPKSFDHITQSPLNSGHYCSVGVDVPELDIYSASPDDFQQVSFKYSGRRGGAVLSLPVKARREDTLAQSDFGEWMVKHIDCWFAYARQLGLGIEQMEEIILITGCDRTRSWTNVMFLGGQLDAEARFGVKVSQFHESDLNIQFSPGHVVGAVLNHGSEGMYLPEDQCVFIRGFRVARTFKIFPKRLRAAAGPSPDIEGHDCEPDTQLLSISATTKYQDPLYILLDYIAEKAPECDMLLIHDDDLERIRGIGEDSPLESLQPDVVMDLLRSSDLEIHKFCCDLSRVGTSTSTDTADVIWVAMLSMLSKDWDSVLPSQPLPPTTHRQDPASGPLCASESPIPSPQAPPDGSPMPPIPGDINLCHGDVVPLSRLGSTTALPAIDKIGHSPSAVWSSPSNLVHVGRHNLVSSVVVISFIVLFLGWIFSFTWLAYSKLFLTLLLASFALVAFFERQHTHRQLDEMYTGIEALQRHLSNPVGPRFVSETRNIFPIAATTIPLNMEPLEQRTQGEPFGRDEPLVGNTNSRRMEESIPPTSPTTTSRVRPGTPQAQPQAQGDGQVPSSTPYQSPAVYSAFLSLVAKAFRDHIVLADIVQDGITYKNAFDGHQAVDKIAYIIRSSDRNLALLLGRALDAQGYFHEVTYDHRLRDSVSNVYQFRARTKGLFHSGGPPRPTLTPPNSWRMGTPIPDAQSESIATNDSDSPLNDAPGESDSRKELDPSTDPDLPSDIAEDIPLPTGVFTLLTDCYSPTCSRYRLCYSVTCPRWLEQLSRGSLDNLEDVEPGILWVHKVPKEIADSVSDQEKMLQEAINEVIYTEHNFVRDMEYLRDVWIDPLNTQDIIPDQRRANFIEQVFGSIHDIIQVNTRLRDQLVMRQKSYAVIEGISDIFLDIVPHFAPFVSYGLHQPRGKDEFEKEKNSNPAFSRFVRETESRPESRKLELNAFLNKPTTRLASYVQLLEAVLKHTPEECSDKRDIPKVLVLIRGLIVKVSILQLEQQLFFRPGEQVDLRLREDGREIIFKGPLKRHGGWQSDELLVILLDHVLLMVKQKKEDQYKVYRRPIPLELLFAIATDESGMRPVVTDRSPHENVNINGGHYSRPYPPRVPIKLEGRGKSGFTITLVYLGRKSYQVTLSAPSYASRRRWIEHISHQQDLIRDRCQFFEMDMLSEGFFQSANRVNCAAQFRDGQKVAYGTFDGIYFQDLREPNKEPIKVLALTDVTQVDVLDEHRLLIALSEGQVITFPLDALEAMDPLAGLKRARRIATHTSFFKSGVSVGRTFICVVKASPQSSTIKIFEPIDSNVVGRSKPTFRKLLQGGNETLRIYKEFYIPTQSFSIHFLRTKLCVACEHGFEIIDPHTLNTQGLLDPNDESLDFVHRRGDKTRPKPVAIYRLVNEFLLCYDDFAFYITRGGRRSRSNFLVYWEGSPTNFALRYPYVLAFEPMFVEIRNVETGSMVQVIQGNNLRSLYMYTDAAFSLRSESSFSSYSADTATHGTSSDAHGSTLVAPYSDQPSIAYGRMARLEDIIIVSDDRVLSLRMVAPPGE